MSEPQYILLGMPDVNGYLRGKALRQEAFDSAVNVGTVMTDLLLGLDPEAARAVPLLACIRVPDPSPSVRAAYAVELEPARLEAPAPLIGVDRVGTIEEVALREAREESGLTHFDIVPIDGVLMPFDVESLRF